MNDKKILVVYYSRTGVTKLVAETIKNTLNCDLEEIVDLKDRKGPIKYALAGRDALKGSTTEIKPMKFNPGDYDVVIFGCPVWASNVVPALRTYIEKYKASLKEVAFFTTEIASGGDKVMLNMENLCNKTPLAKIRFTKKDMSSKEYINSINEFVTNIK